MQPPSRFIPARAGNTSFCFAGRTRSTVHPRPAREHSTYHRQRLIDTGSSPPARGTRRGLTSQPGSMPVHPRPRGEHAARRRRCWSTAGSSPPARGTRPSASPAARAARFIPARAGNTAPTSSSASPCPVHPRPRGEHTKAPAFRIQLAGSSRPRGEHERAEPSADREFGSSPPARGTLAVGASVRRHWRFIPARAGNTTDGCSDPACGPVHPAPRGEHLLTYSGLSVSTGSSPPARGTLLTRTE